MVCVSHSCPQSAPASLTFGPPRKPLTSKLAPTMTLGLGVTTFMFLFTYIPQMAVMAFTSGPLAAISAALLVLSESSTLFTILSKTFLIEDALTDTFDGVLVSKNTTNLVSEGRQIKAGGDPMAKLGKLVLRPFQSRSTPCIFSESCRSFLPYTWPMDAHISMPYRVHAYCSCPLLNVPAPQFHSSGRNSHVRHIAGTESRTGCTYKILSVEAME